MTFIEFLLQYYVYILVVLVILIVGVIGFLVDSKNKNSDKKESKSKKDDQILQNETMSSEIGIENIATVNQTANSEISQQSSNDLVSDASSEVKLGTSNNNSNVVVNSVTDSTSGNFQSSTPNGTSVNDFATVDTSGILEVGNNGVNASSDATSVVQPINPVGVSNSVSSNEVLATFGNNGVNVSSDTTSVVQPVNPVGVSNSIPSNGMGMTQDKDMSVNAISNNIPSTEQLANQNGQLVAANLNHETVVDGSIKEKEEGQEQNTAVNSGIFTTDGSQPFDISSMFANNQ